MPRQTQSPHFVTATMYSTSIESDIICSLCANELENETREYYTDLHNANLAEINITRIVMKYYSMFESTHRFIISLPRQTLTRSLQFTTPMQYNVTIKSDVNCSLRANELENETREYYT